MATDYIIRDDLLKRLGIDDLDCTKCSWGDRHGFVCKRGCDFQDACEAIEDAEPADVVPSELYQRALSDVVTLSVERKRGKWIEFPACSAYKDAYCDTHIVCSACEAVFDILNNDTERFNFCPNCGADMRGEP